MQFKRDLPKNKRITALLIFWPENLEKYRSTELYNAPLEGSTIFLYRSSTSRTSLVSSGLAELKYAFSAGQDVTLKNYGAQTSFHRRSQSMGF